MNIFDVMRLEVKHLIFPEGFRWIGLGILGIGLMLTGLVDLTTVFSEINAGAGFLARLTLPLGLFIILFSKSKTQQDQQLKVHAGYFTIYITCLALLVSGFLVYLNKGYLPEISIDFFLYFVLLVFAFHYFLNSIFHLVEQKQSVFFETVTVVLSGTYLLTFFVL